jgi:hypothetical protein
MPQGADAIVCVDWRITTRQLAFSLSVSKGSNIHIIRDLGSWKVCTIWVPRNHTLEHKTERKVISSGLARFEAEGETFQSRNVKASKTCIRNFEPETKIQSMK